MLLTHILHPIPYLFNNSQTVAFSGLSNLWNVTYIPQTHHSCYPTDDMCLFRPSACWAVGEKQREGFTLQRLLIVIGKLIEDKAKVHFQIYPFKYVLIHHFCLILLLILWSLAYKEYPTSTPEALEERQQTFLQWYFTLRRINICEEWSHGRTRCLNWSLVMALLFKKKKKKIKAYRLSDLFSIGDHWDRGNMRGKKQTKRQITPKKNSHILGIFPMGKSLKTYGQQHQVQSIVVELSVINQSTRACEMEDSWRVQYRQSERTALSKTIIWCIIHTVSMVSLLLPPSLSQSLRLCLSLSLLSRSGLVSSLLWRLWWSPALFITHSSPAARGLHISMMHSHTVPFK